MSTICDSDLHHLKPGKTVVLKSFKGCFTAPENTPEQENYWQLIGSKAVVSALPVKGRALVTFQCDLQSLGLTCANERANSLWVLVGDLKFVCRY